MLKKLANFIDSPGASNSYEKKGSGHSGTRASIGESFDFLSLRRAWKEISGDKLSQHTIPLKNQNGTLIVLSNHSAFANELSFMELPLKKKIFERFPSLEKSIKSIKFIVDSTHFDRQYAQFVAPLEKEKVNQLHPYSPEYKRLKKEAEMMFGDLEDQELKERMISLYLQLGAGKSS